MKELRSTEILDNEIAEDARRRSEQILETADAMAAEIAEQVPSRVAEALAERSRELEADLERLLRNQEAILPLNQIRLRVSYEYAAVLQAMDAYLAALTAAQREAIVADQVASYRSFLDGQSVMVEYFGMTKKTATELVEKHGGAKVTEMLELGDVLPLEPSPLGISVQAGVIVSTQNGEVTCRASLDERAEAIAADHLFQLTEALFGRGESA